MVSDVDRIDYLRPKLSESQTRQMQRAQRLPLVWRPHFRPTFARTTDMAEPMFTAARVKEVLRYAVTRVFVFLLPLCLCNGDDDDDYVVTS